MNIVSQICNDRHPEVFELKDKYQLISSASKGRMRFIAIELTFVQSSRINNNENRTRRTEKTNRSKRNNLREIF